MLKTIPVKRVRIPWRFSAGLVLASTTLPAGGAEPADSSLAVVEKLLMETVTDIWHDFIQHVPFLVAGLVVLLLTWIGVNLISNIAGRLLGRADLRPSLKDLILKLITIAVWVLGLLLTAMIVFPGLTPAKALGGLGVVSLAVGFAFKEIFENFFAGILLLWRFPFEHNDYIECGGIKGQVEEISARMTLIREITGELVIVPNSFLFKNPVVVMTNAARRRISLVVGVAYGTNVEAATSTIEDAVNACASVDDSRPAQVFAQSFGASSIDIDVAWWAASDPLGERRSRAEVLHAIHEALGESGIEIPFPHRTLTFNETLSVHNAAETSADTAD